MERKITIIRSNKSIKDQETRKIDGYSDRAYFVDRFNRRFIVSYYTIVGYIDCRGRFHRTWGGYSKTTVDKHIAASGFYFSKKDWEKLPVENLPKYKGFQLGYYDIVSYSDSRRNLKLMTDNPYYYPRFSYGF